MILEYNLTDDVLAYAFDGPMDAPTINNLRAQILKKLAYHDRINIYLEDRSTDYFTSCSVLQGILFPLKHHNRFRKVAFVTDRRWIHLLSNVNGLFIGADIKNYKSEQRIEALNWIMTP